MATTYTNARAASTVMPRSNHQGLTAVTATQTIATALVVNDVIEMVKVPNLARVVEVVLISEDLDTGTTAAVVLAVGDGAVTNRYISGSTIGQAGGVARMDQITAVDFAYSADDTIDVKVTTAPATGATGVKITLTVFYTQHK